MPKIPEQDEFKGLSKGAGEDSLPPGYYVEFVNVDSFVGNNARARPGLLRVTTPGAAEALCVASGDLVDAGFTSAPASGTDASGSWGDFTHPVMSGVFINHPASGNIPQVVRSGDRVYGKVSGAYASGSLFTNKYALWAAGYDYTEAEFGPFCEGFNHYARAIHNSGYVSPLQIVGVGVAVRIQPEVESFYAAFMTEGSVVGGTDITNYGMTIVKVESGVAKSDTGGSIFAATAKSGEIRIEAVDNVDGTVTVNAYYQGALKHTFSDNSTATYGIPLTSGYVGLGGRSNLATSAYWDGPTWNFLTEWDGGTLKIAARDGIGTDAPSGYAAVINAFEPFGTLNYFYIDQSGNRFLFADPREDS